MSENWKPGTIALVNGDVCIYLGRGRGWEHGREDRFAHNEQSADVRPLVVIDPENEDDVTRLADALVDHHSVAYGVESDWLSIQAALREFANPTPPKPDEPTGLGAVVEDAEGGKWIRVNVEHDLPRPWASQGNVGGNMDGWIAYANLKAVRVLSEGVTA